MTNAAAPYEAKFRWEQQDQRVEWQTISDPGEGDITLKVRQDAQPGDTLTLKEIEVRNVPGEQSTLNEGAAAYSKFYKDEVGKGVKVARSKRTMLAPNVPNTVQLEAEEFICLDAGSWLAGHQNFALISNGAVFLCNYDPKSASVADLGGKGPAWQFLQNIPGCTVARGPVNVYTHGTAMRDDELYVVIPDMHIPQTADSNEATRARYRLWEKMAEKALYRPPFTDLNHAAYRAMRMAAGEYGNGRNFLEGLTGIDALKIFLDAVRHFVEAGAAGGKLKITLLQVGDMYELWAYRPCHFGDTGDAVAESLVVREPHIVAEWIAGTHFLFHETFAAFDRCKESGIRLVFVHGNHDCYLLDRKVRHFANEWLRDLKGFAKSLDLGEEFDRVGFQPSTVHERMACFEENGIHVEHSHNHYDVSNHDGAASGQSFTDFGAKMGSISKQFDSLRRASFVRGAASVYFGNPFRIYIMGHTHGMDVNNVRVTHWLDGKNVRVLPKEGA